MEKRRARHRRFPAGKAGFSLVELIIVIAIMAALVAVLAPQYSKYVEKSRKTADLDSLDAVLTAVKVLMADPDTTASSAELQITAAGKIQIQVDGAWKDISASGLTGFGKDLYETLGTDTLLLKSETYQKVQTITATTAKVTASWS